MKKVILVHGAKYSGKGHFTSFFMSLLEKNSLIGKQISFAEPIQRTASVLGFTDEAVYGKDKETWVHPVMRVTYRKFAQQFGTEFIRKSFNQHFFAELAVARIEYSSADFFIVDDCRFANEYDLVKLMCSKNGYKFVPVKLHREEFNFTGEHSSEVGLPDSQFIRVIDNNSDTEHFSASILSLIRDFDLIN